MSRVANYTIKGFLYQFNVTLLTILDMPDDAITTVEGLIEDIDIETKGGINAIQCKYHETKENFVLSSVYEPILQMMVHYKRHSDSQIGYTLYAHFPGEPIGKKEITLKEFETILKSTNKDLQKFTSELGNGIDVSGFIGLFNFVIGPAYDTTVKNVHKKLVDNGLNEDDLDTLIYPNAMTIIGDLSIQPEADKRQITKSVLLQKLNTIRTVAISRWAASLRNYEQLLKEKRKQLKSNLDKNARVRHIFLSQELEQFTEEVVIFINEYLQKFHFKPCHLYPPLFCLDCDDEQFKEIRKRIIAKKLKINDGYLVDEFIREHFLREPIVNPSKKMREFDLRITTINIAKNMLEETICDDLYIVAPQDDIHVSPIDVNVERLAVRSFKELRYIFGMDKSYG